MRSSQKAKRRGWPKRSEPSLLDGKNVVALQQPDFVEIRGLIKTWRTVNLLRLPGPQAFSHASRSAASLAATSANLIPTPFSGST